MPRRSERHFFTNDDGLKLAAIVEHPEEAPRGMILFSHCFTCSKDLKTIVKLTRRLAELGWASCRYDFRGIGQSEGVFSESNFTTNLADLVATAKWLDSNGLSPQFLFGHSFGGAASLAVLNELPPNIVEKLQGVITLAAPSDTAHLADILLGMNPQISEGEGEVQIGGKNFLINTQMLENFRSVNFAERIEDIQRTVKCSFLIIHSLVDKTVDHRHAGKLFDMLTKIKGPEGASDSILCNLKSADHLLAENPEDIELVANLINGWCRQRLGG